MRRRIAAVALSGGTALVFSIWSAGTAMAVSGGPYQPNQQDCSPTAEAYNPSAQQSWQGTQPGCHNTALNVESGGTTDGSQGTTGQPSSDNTRYAEVGVDQNPDGPSPNATPTVLGQGFPGQPNAVHQGCASANTAGTNSAGSDTSQGCGNNPNGTGFEANWNYYDLYCTVAQNLPPVTVTDPSGGQVPWPTGQPYAYAGPCVQQTEWTQTTGVTPDTTPPSQTQAAQLLSDIAGKGLLVYFGVDDNVDAGEHDGVICSQNSSTTSGGSTSGGSKNNGKHKGSGGSSGGTSTSPVTCSEPTTAGAVNGPSDGGGLGLWLQPQNATNTPSQTDPVPVAGTLGGFCADGNCVEWTTRKSTVYQGCNAQSGEDPSQDQCSSSAPKSRDVYDYSGKQWDPYSCASGDVKSQSPSSCDTSATNPSPSGSTNSSGGMDYWRQNEAQQVNAEPGVQEYEDPDPQGSPAVQQTYPNPALYVGTCGVVAGGGMAPAAPPSPVTNQAGQVDVNTGC